MLISVRDNKGNLLIKDVLDLDYDMFIRECLPESGCTGYEIWINKKYKCSDIFATIGDAEERMLELAEERNILENELKSF